MTTRSWPAPAPASADPGLVTWLLNRGLLAALDGDTHQLLEVRGELHRLGAAGEAALVDGLRGDLHGDRGGARRQFARAVSLCTGAHALGEGRAALERLGEAVVATEPLRNGLPFLGWSRHGTPIGTLLARLASTGATPWLSLLVATAVASPELARHFAPGVRDSAAPRAGLPTLSPREHDVLVELGRGSTYADIASTLVIAESTVKTHVSSLYAKLGVSRRGEALAVARGSGLV